MKKQDKLILIAIIGVICYYMLQVIIFENFGVICYYALQAIIFAIIWIYFETLIDWWHQFVDILLMK
jgi:hypothetical protein